MPMTADVWVIAAVALDSARAMPKSMTLTVPFGVIITFPGFMSRWMMPLRCEKSSAAQMSAVISSARCGISRPSPTSTSLRVLPSTYSMTMNGSVPSASLSSPVS